MTDEPKKSIPNLLYKTDGSESFDKDQPGSTPKAVDRVVEILARTRELGLLDMDASALRAFAEQIVAAVHDGT